MAETLNDLIEGENFSRMCECGEFFEFKGSGVFVCPQCGKEYLTDFGKIRRFLDKNGPANALTIAKATGISRSVVSRFLRDGRLEVSSSVYGDKDENYCRRCGNMIFSGLYCDSCAKQITNSSTSKIGFSNPREFWGDSTEGIRRFDRNKKK